MFGTQAVNTPKYQSIEVWTLQPSAASESRNFSAPGFVIKQNRNGPSNTLCRIIIDTLWFSSLTWSHDSLILYTVHEL